jgi:hypothetical protein
MRLLCAMVAVLVVAMPHPTAAKSPQPGQEEAPMDHNNTLCIDAQLGNLHSVKRALERVRTRRARCCGLDGDRSRE